MSAQIAIVELGKEAIVPERAAAALTAKLGESAKYAGAAASFTGTVRTAADEELTGMLLEHYPGMAEKQLRKIALRELDAHSLFGVGLWHRYGMLRPRDVIVYVHAVAPGRQAAFAACSAIVDYLKTDAPFWKKETGSFGERWVAPRAGEDRPRAAKQ